MTEQKHIPQQPFRMPWKTDERQQNVNRREAIPLIAERVRRSPRSYVQKDRKESMVLQAEGIRKQQILRAEAKEEATIRETEGQAEAIVRSRKRMHRVNQSGQPKLTIQSASVKNLKLIC